jgi:hypothetical protein
MAAYGTQVWLLREGSKTGPIIGFVSVGDASWALDAESDDETNISIIPFVGIQRPHWGQGNEDGKYSDQFMDFIKHVAESHADRQPFIGLHVHPQNIGAIKLYKRHNYVFRQHKNSFENGVDYLAMILEF